MVFPHLSYDGLLFTIFQGNVAEWLWRWPAKPLGSARVGSNPAVVETFGIYRFNLLIVYSDCLTVFYNVFVLYYI